MTLWIVFALVGGASAFAATMIAFQMIDQINAKLPESERLRLLGWSTDIKKQHRALYPDSRLGPAMNLCTAVMVLSFILLVWSTPRR